MLEHLNLSPADPILQLMVELKNDPRDDTIDLGVGVYKDEAGNTPVLGSVKTAEAHILVNEHSKAYVGPAGNALFNERLSGLLLGTDHPAFKDNRVRALQAPGGCGALRAMADLIAISRPGATVWISDPTWANHKALLAAAGLNIASYPYYNQADNSLRFDEMLNALKAAGPNDVVLLHGCCHNPCGADLNPEQWRQVAELANQQGFLPFIDIAYQGFGEGLDEDAAGVRIMAEHCPEVLIAASCSKNFGLYRERVGLAVIVAANSTTADAALSQTLGATRANYSMPPSHGASVVAHILDTELKQQWQGELAEKRARINGLRHELADALAARGCDQFGFIPEQKGMFSFLGLSQAQVARIKAEHGVYMVNSSRINIAGVNKTNIDRLVEAIAAVV